jgi:hypothetical protein
MKVAARKAAVAAYKERKVIAGVYAVRCAPTGQCWVGRTPNLGAVQNRLWFTLRHGGYPQRALQAAWRDYGAEAFAFEELERLDDEMLADLGDRGLKDRLAHWRETLDAEPI